MSGRSTRRWSVLLLLATVGGIVAVLAVGLTGAMAQQASDGGTKAPLHYKFDPSINAPWAQEGDEADVLDSPSPNLAAICRSTLFNTTNPYAPTTNVDTIVG